MLTKENVYGARGNDMKIDDKMRFEEEIRRN